MMKGKSLLDYIYLFSSNEYKNNDKYWDILKKLEPIGGKTCIAESRGCPPDLAAWCTGILTCVF